MALLVGGVRPCPPGHVSTYHVFHSLATSPDTRHKVALHSDNTTITYGQLQEMVDSLHHWLWRHVQDIVVRCGRQEVGAGDLTTVGLCLHRSPKLVALILAIWKLGWAYVPLDPTVPALRTLYVLRDAEPACVVTDAHTNIKIRQLECDTALSPVTEQVPHPAHPPSPRYCLANRVLDIGDWVDNSSTTAEGDEGEKCSSVGGGRGGEVACVLYTSGSTGNPKGVQLTMKNLMNRLHWQWEELPYKRQEVCLMSKSLTFVDSLTEVMGPLLAGVPVVVVREAAINPELVIQYVRQHRVTRLVLVPSLLKLLLLYLNTTKESIRVLHHYIHVWITSGEILPGWLINDFFAMFPGSKFINLYGSTEVTGDVSYFPIEEVNWRAGVKVPIGTPVANTALLVARTEGDALCLAGEDQPGEILVLSKNVCVGYLAGRLSRGDHTSFIPLSSVVVRDDGTRHLLYDYIDKIYQDDHHTLQGEDDDERETLSKGSQTDDLQNGNYSAAQHERLTQKAPAMSVREPSVEGGACSVPPSVCRASPGSASKSTTTDDINRRPAPTPTAVVRISTPPAVPPRTSTPPAVPPRATPPKVPPRSVDPAAGQTKATDASGSCSGRTPVAASAPPQVAGWRDKVLLYRTGDLGRVVGGQLVFEGRRDAQVKVQGVRVHLAEVEDAVHRSGYVDTHCVVAAKEQDSEDDDQVLVAFVVLKKEFEDRDTPITEDLGRCLRTYLPQAVVPRLVVVDALPLLPSGKVDRQSLLKLYRRRMSHRCSRDNILILRKEEPIESRVLRIICGALGVSRSHDVLQRNFFALGGTSISSVSVVVRLRELGLDVTLDTFLKAATIGDVVNDILKAKTMAEVMNLFCSPSPTAPSSAPARSPTASKGEEEGGGSEEEEEVPVSELGIPALHPDIPMCPGLLQQEGTRGKTKGIRLANLHTLPVSQGVDKHTVIEMVAESFTTKNPLDVTMKVPRSAHRSLLNALWPRLVQDDLSFVVKDPQRGILGAVINTDFFNEPQVRVPATMEEIAALHHPLEEEVRHQLRQESTSSRDRGARWVHNLFLATNTCLTPQDNVRLALHLEKELLRMAQTRFYHGVFTVNSNPLNQLLCENYLGYQRRGAVRVSSFIHEGRQPFVSLPHDLLLVAITKTI